MDEWRLEELAARVAVALSGYEGAPNGRVREIPDARAIRYYTTLGLLDRPLRMDGRTALYGRRHLMQIVAIKRLQSEGLALADVQTRLAGMGEAALGRIARVPKAAETVDVGAAVDAVKKADAKQPVDAKSEIASEARKQEAPARAAFWSATPVEAEKGDESRVRGLSSNERAYEPVDEGEVGEGAVTGTWVTLAPGVVLLLEADVSLPRDDVEALRVAAGPLLDAVAKVKSRVMR